MGSSCVEGEIYDKLNLHLQYDSKTQWNKTISENESRPFGRVKKNHE